VNLPVGRKRSLSPPSAHNPWSLCSQYNKRNMTAHRRKSRGFTNSWRTISYLFSKIHLAVPFHFTNSPFLTPLQPFPVWHILPSLPAVIARNGQLKRHDGHLLLLKMVPSPARCMANAEFIYRSHAQARRSRCFSPTCKLTHGARATLTMAIAQL
jgi:hypothetical protein